MEMGEAPLQLGRYVPEATEFYRRPSVKNNS